MKITFRIFIVVCLAIFISPSLQAQSKKDKSKKRKSKQSVALENQTDSISYALGMDVGTNLKETGMTLSMEQLYRGLVAAMDSAKTSEINDSTRQALIRNFQQEIQEKKQQEREQKAALALEEGRLFLEENGKKEGVVTQPSGLQYKIIRPGTGPQPEATSTVVVHYEGRLIDDTIFDSSYKRGEPLDLPLNRVIAGWTEGIQLMKTGAKWQLFIPSDLGYGPNGAGNQIGPNQVLIFDVELLEVK